MIYSKTETGQQVVKDRSVPLTPRQRSALILFDGKRTVDGVLAATAGMGVTAEDIQFMADSGLLAVVEGLLRLRPRPLLRLRLPWPHQCRPLHLRWCAAAARTRSVTRTRTPLPLHSPPTWVCAVSA